MSELTDPLQRPLLMNLQTNKSHWREYVAENIDVLDEDFVTLSVSEPSVKNIRVYVEVLLRVPSSPPGLFSPHHLQNSKHWTYVRFK